MNSKQMEEFCRISRYAGMREDIVQAGGGNSSVKISESEMVIKASGYALSEMNGKEGYAVVDWQRAVEIVQMQGKVTMEKEAAAQIRLRGEKPSIEVFLHAIMQKYTLHTHPVVVNILTCRKNWKEELQELFPGAVLVPYATPGIELARICQKQMENYRSDVIFLQNHGLIVSGETAEEVMENHERTIEKIRQKLGSDIGDEADAWKLAKTIQSVIPQFDQIVYQTKDIRIYESLRQGIAWEENMAVSPDVIVYCGERPLVLLDDVKQEIAGYYERYGMPTIICMKGKVYIVAENVKKAMEIQSTFAFALQTICHNQKKEMNLLSREEQNFLRAWDAEKYRRSKK